MRRLLGAIGFLAAATALPAAAQTPLFAEESELAFTLSAPLSTLVRTSRNSTDPHPATLTLATGQEFPLQLSARGFSRRTRDLCTFPPLRIDLERGALSGTLMQGQNRLKLVTHCRPQASYEQLIVLEYMTYRLYNVLTPVSFRVRPVRVTYHDTEGRRDDTTRFAFLIEDTGDLASRNSLVEMEVPTRSVRSTQLDADQTALYALFQYMIGNLDFDPLQGPEGEDCCHNSKLLAREGATSNIMPAPYDFDFSGLVNAPYSGPPESIPVSSVRERYYRGYCRHNDQLPTAAQLFRDRREALMNVVRTETRLSEGDRRSAERYLTQFFGILDNPGAFQREIIARCRG